MKTYDPATHTYKTDDVVRLGVTTILKKAGLIDTDAPWFDEYSRERGTAVHLACELWDIGTLDEATLDPVLVPYLDGWRLFMAETGAVWDNGGIEARVDHDTLGYAGRLDRIGTVSGKRALVDIKTGVPQPWTALQLAAYARARGEICERIAAHLPGDGKYKIHRYPIANLIRDFDVFQACLTVVNWKESK